MFEVHVEVWPGSAYSLVRVEGEVDLLSRADLARALLYAVAPFAHRPLRSVVVDVRGVWFFAASGVGCLQEADERLAAPARLALVCPDRCPTRRLVELLGLQDRWPMRPDLAGAVAAVSPPP